MKIVETLQQMDRALTVEEVAKLLKMSKRTIYEYAASKRIPSFKVGASVRIDPDDFAKWLLRGQ